MTEPKNAPMLRVVASRRKVDWRRLVVGLFMVGMVSAVLGQSESGPGQLTRFTFTEYHMGVDARLIVYAPDQTTAENACAAAFEKMADLDTIMSDYRKESELMKLCDVAWEHPVKVSPDLFKVLKMSAEVSRLSDGYFDITVGPIVRLWRAARKTHLMPTPAELAAARKLVGWQMVKLDEAAQTVKLARRGMKLDLGAIGKGYGDDEAQKVLKKFGITRALVEMGGDIVVSDPPPGKSGWTFEVPNYGGLGNTEMIFANEAVSSSGDTEEYAMIGGKRFSHVVDPHTGMALTNRVQATLIAPTGLIADPVSTAMTLVSRAGRERLLRAYPGTQVYVRVLPND